MRYIERHHNNLHTEVKSEIVSKAENSQRKKLENISWNQSSAKRIRAEITSDQVVDDACLEIVNVNGRPFSLMDDSGFEK